MKKEPKSEKPSFFKELGEYIRPYRGQFALSIIVSLLAVFCGLAVYGVVGVLSQERLQIQHQSAVICTEYEGA